MAIKLEARPPFGAASHGCNREVVESQDTDATMPPTQQDDDAEAAQYPTGIRLSMISIGLMLAVICSNMVSTASFMTISCSTNHYKTQSSMYQSC